MCVTIIICILNMCLFVWFIVGAVGISFTLDRLLAHAPSQIVDDNALLEIADKVDVDESMDKVADAAAARAWERYDAKFARQRRAHVDSRVSWFFFSFFQCIRSFFLKKIPSFRFGLVCFVFVLFWFVLFLFCFCF